MHDLWIAAATTRGHAATQSNRIETSTRTLYVAFAHLIRTVSVSMA